ncbi:MAG: transposase [Hyphomicrobiales bacterium]
MVSLKGIGPRAAAVFLSGIANVDHFEDADKPAASPGIVPRISPSNETDNRDRMTKRGDTLMPTTLVQCTADRHRLLGRSQCVPPAHQGSARRRQGDYRHGAQAA